MRATRGSAAGVLAAAVLAGTLSCGNEHAVRSEDPACIPGELEEAVPGTALMLCIEPHPPLTFAWSVPDAIAVPFGGSGSGLLGLAVADASGSFTYTVGPLAIACRDPRAGAWIPAPGWRASLEGDDLSCAPGRQLASPVRATFTIPGDAALPPGGGLECVGWSAPFETTWCRERYVTPPSPAFPIAVGFVAVSGAPDDAAASFALDQTLPYTGAIDGVAGDGAAWQQVRLAARAFELSERRDVVLAFEFAFAPPEASPAMKLDVRLKLDGEVAAEGRFAADATRFEAVVPGVEASRHVVSVEARGVAGDAGGAPLRLTGPAGGPARLVAVF